MKAKKDNLSTLSTEANISNVIIFQKDYDILKAALEKERNERR